MLCVVFCVLCVLCVVCGECLVSIKKWDTNLQNSKSLLGGEGGANLVKSQHFEFVLNTSLIKVKC